MKKFFTLILTLAACLNGYAADSPMFRGPKGDGIFEDTGLMKTWPEGGPALAWKVDGVGAGYAGPAVANGTVFINGSQEGSKGVLIALDLAGKEKWRAEYGPESEDKMAVGSRGTPCVDGDRVYVYSGLGLMSCLSAADGKPLWSVDVAKEFQAQDTMWDISESPIVDGNLVFATPGGVKATVVALDKMTGKTVWATNVNGEHSAYCTPDVFQFGKTRLLVTMTAKSVVGIDASDGKLLWTHEHVTNYDIHATTPVRDGNIIYYSAG